MLRRQNYGKINMIIIPKTPFQSGLKNLTGIIVGIFQKLSNNSLPPNPNKPTVK
jgi:hypothetical protein